MLRPVFKLARVFVAIGVGHLAAAVENTLTELTTVDIARRKCHHANVNSAVLEEASKLVPIQELDGATITSAIVVERARKHVAVFIRQRTLLTLAMIEHTIEIRCYFSLFLLLFLTLIFVLAIVSEYISVDDGTLAMH